MKSAIVCFKCKKIKRFSDSYALKVLDTSDMMQVAFVGKKGGEVGFISKEKKVRVCRTCIKQIGYKVKKLLVNTKK